MLASLRKYAKTWFAAIIVMMTALYLSQRH